MSNNTGVEEEETKFDPNAGVPLWVNVVIPILLGLLFVLILLILYRTKKEVPVEKLEGFVASIPLINRYLSTEWIEHSEEADEAKTKKHAQTKDARFGVDNHVFTVEDAKAYEANGRPPVEINRRTAANGQSAGFVQSTRM